MKLSFILFSLCALVFLFSCGEGTKTQEPAIVPSVPEALQDNSSDVSLLRKGSHDLVYELYQELVEKDPGLKKMEEHIDQIKGIPEEVAKLEKFQHQNWSYYLEARRHASDITDTVLRKRLLAMISESSRKDSLANDKLNRIMDKIDENEIAIQDYHNVLMIVKTLPVIEEYQKNKRPDPSPWQKYIKEQEGLILEIKKNTPPY